MTTMTTARPDQTRGARITDREQLTSLPRGTTFTVHPELHVNADRYRINPDDGSLDEWTGTTWRHRPGSQLRSTRLDGYLVIDEVPVPSVTAGGIEFTVGMPMESMDHLNNVPVGTEFQSRGSGAVDYRVGFDGDRRVLENRRDGGAWGNGIAMTSVRTDGYLVITSLPDAEPVIERPQSITVNGTTYTVGDMMDADFPDWQSDLPVGTEFTWGNTRYRVGERDGILQLEQWRSGATVWSNCHPLSSCSNGIMTIASFPEVATSNVTPGRLSRMSEFNALPVGAVIQRASDNAEQWRKDSDDNEDDHCWVYLGDPALHCSVRGFTPYRGWQVIGTVAAPSILMDERVTADNWHLLPIDGEMRSRGGTVWRKISETQMQSVSSGTIRNSEGFSFRTVRVSRLPNITVTPVITMSGEVPDPMGTEIPLAPETLRQFQQRFFTTTWGCALLSGVSTAYHEQTMHRLGADAEVYQNLSIGMAVHQGDADRWDRLPEGTVVEAGHPLGDCGDGDYVVNKTRPSSTGTTLLGTPRSDNYRLWRVKSGPGLVHAAWAQEVWTPDMITALVEWKDQAEARGRRLRADHSWCGQYYRDVARMGLWEAGRDGMPVMPRVSEYLSADQVSALPQHTVLVWEGHGHFVWVVRDDRMTNPSRTRHISGSLPGDWAPHNLRVVARPEERIRVRAADSTMLACLGVGSVVDCGGTMYDRKEDGRFGRLGRRPSDYNPADLAGPQTRITAFSDYVHPTR